MGEYFSKLKDYLAVRMPPIPIDVVEAIDALREFDEALLKDDLSSCQGCLSIAAAALGSKEGVGLDNISEPSSSRQLGESELLNKYGLLRSTCADVLREHNSQAGSVGLNKWLLGVFAALLLVSSVAAAIPYLMADGKIANVRTQVFWNRYPGGIRESYSRYTPVVLDGEWHEVRVRALDPMTAVRIDPATDSTVLDYYDVRNVRVVWRNPDEDFESELELGQIHWADYNCAASRVDEYLHISDMEPDCYVVSMTFPAYYEVSEVVFEARSQSQKLTFWDWLTWTLAWRSILM